MNDVVSNAEQSGDKQRPPPDWIGASASRTLYVTRQGAVLSWKRGRFRIKHKGELIADIPSAQIDRVLILGNVSVTTPCLHRCLARGVPIVLGSSAGTCRGIAAPLGFGALALRRAQLSAADDQDTCLAIGREIVAAKIANGRTVLKRYARHHDFDAFDRGVAAMKPLIRQAAVADEIARLMGIEGAASRAFFTAWREALDKSWRFEKRQRRPPPDPINGMLSFGYSLLYQQMLCLLQAAGFIVQQGFLHSPRAGHAALVSDLIEEFRSPIVDATVLRVSLGRRIRPEDFRSPDGQTRGCRLTSSGRKIFINELERTLDSVFTDGNGNQMSYRQCMDRQTRRLGSWLLKSEPAYEAFRLR